ncbi:hypothetical protein AAG906_005669 [Vitis piasezkii]
MANFALCTVHASANFAPAHASANFAPCIVHATLLSLLSFSLFYFLFLGSQTTSEDVFPEDERLNLWFLGVKEARILKTRVGYRVNIMDPPQEDQNSQHIITPYCALLPNFHGMESENPYAHIKEFEEVCNTFREGGASIDLMRLKLFPFTLKDKAKIWLNSLRPRSIRNWVDLQAEFLKKFFPTHRTNGLKRQISNFSAQENEKFYECWERYMEAINACPHHGFDTWLLVSYFYDGIEKGKFPSQQTQNPKAGMYMLSEDVDMKAKVATLSKPFPILKSMSCHAPFANHVIMPNNNAPYGNTYNSSWRNHPNFSWKPRPPPYQPQAQTQAPQQTSSVEQAIVNLSKVMGDFVGEQKTINSQLHQKIENVESSQIKRMDGMQNDLSQKIDNIQYSISRLTNLNTLNEKGKFPLNQAKIQRVFMKLKPKMRSLQS